MKRFLFLAVVCFAQMASAALKEPIQVEGGLVSGTPAWGWGVRLFRGIPYAAPPVGDLRWRPPQPVIPWQGVLAADHFSSACMQLPRAQDNIGWRDGLVPNSEDCLYLNIWTPAKSPGDKLPVMVWIHGGGFREGSGAETAWHGDNLAKKGVVLITFNYRLTVFGFFAHPDLTAESEHHSSGNYALLDQIAALRWVQKNIAHFGGDPNNATIFGQSAGGASVAMHMASPLSRGLFQHAIGQSGGISGGVPLAQAEQAGLRFAESLGAHSIAELRAKPAAAVLSAMSADSVRFGAVVDGWVFPEDLVSIFVHGHQNDVPLICGSTADDGVPPGSRLKPAEVAAYAKTNFGDLADEYLKLFPANSDEQAKKSARQAGRTRALYGAKRWVSLQVTTGRSPAYWYLFSHPAPVPPDSFFDGKTAAEVGAYHGGDNIYTFDNLRMKDWPWKDVDRKLGGKTSTESWAVSSRPSGFSLPGPAIRTAPVCRNGDPSMPIIRCC
jgi:para-nitrobenzyl esterase